MAPGVTTGGSLKGGEMTPVQVGFFSGELDRYVWNVVSDLEEAKAQATEEGATFFKYKNYPESGSEVRHFRTVRYTGKKEWQEVT